MFGIKCFILKTILLWSIATVVLVESAARHKKDVHHMIILNDDTKPPKSHRYKHHSHRTVKRKPSKKHKHRHYSSSEESFEESSEEELPPPTSKSKAKRHHHHNHKHNSYNRHKDQKHRKDHRSHTDDHNRHHPNSYRFPESKWVPMSSHELFGRNQNYQGLTPPREYHSGAIHYSQPIPMEITTSLPLSHSGFVNFESTLYPPLNKGYIGAVDSYKPYDYSVLEQNTPNLLLPTMEVSTREAPHDQQHPEPMQISPQMSGTPLSIVVKNSVESKDENGNIRVENPNRDKKSKYKRGRGSNRYRIRRTNN